jgi:transcriptional regulator
MVLTRQEKEQRILDLSQQGYTTREIARDTHTSFRDISTILKRTSKQKEIGKAQAERASISTNAYRLFSKGKTTLEVTLALQLKADEAIEYHKEYCKLIQHDDLIHVYKEVKGNIWPLVTLHRLLTAAGMTTTEVINLLKIANNDLSTVRSRFETLSKDVISLELEKQNSNRILLRLNNQISNFRERMGHNFMFLQELNAEIDQVYQRKMKLEGLIRHFENNNQRYLTIKKNIEEKVFCTLCGGKMFLELALFSLIESISNNADKYTSLLYLASSSPTYYNGKHYGPHIYEEYPSKIQDYKVIMGVILEEAEKLFNKLAKKIGEESITYASKMVSSSFSLLPSFDEEEKTCACPEQVPLHNPTETHKKIGHLSNTNSNDNITKK